MERLPNVAKYISLNLNAFVYIVLGFFLLKPEIVFYRSLGFLFISVHPLSPVVPYLFVLGRKQLSIKTMNALSSCFTMGIYVLKQETNNNVKREHLMFFLIIHM